MHYLGINEMLATQFAQMARKRYMKQYNQDELPCKAINVKLCSPCHITSREPLSGQKILNRFTEQSYIMSKLGPCISK
jgi:hypothetical protein